jgi:predicted glutamine amidotransferase
MCIAIIQKAGKRIPTEWLVNSFLGNDDGAGFAYIKDGKVEIAKGYMTMKSFLPAYEELHNAYGKDNPMLIHCRIATAGRVGADNCHPFPIKGGALIHNGHLWSTDGGRDGDKSDTREFAEKFYNILDYNSVMEAIAHHDFADAIGHDRMAMLYDDGRYAVAGSWHNEDVGLFSNSGYKYSYGSYGGACGWNDEWDYVTTH